MANEKSELEWNVNFNAGVTPWLRRLDSAANKSQAFSHVHQAQTSRCLPEIETDTLVRYRKAHAFVV
jgi:hypothetical protein